MKYTSKNIKILKTLQETRLKKSFSCQEMARKLGISKTFYWQIENGNRRLTYEMAKKISIILNSKPDKLFYKDI